MAFIDNSQQIYAQRQGDLRDKRDRMDANFMGAIGGLQKMEAQSKAEAMQQAEIARADEIRKRQEAFQMLQLEQDAASKGQTFDREAASAYLAGPPRPVEQTTTDVPWASKIFGKGSAKVQPVYTSGEGMAGVTSGPIFQDTEETKSARKLKGMQAKADYDKTLADIEKSRADARTAGYKPNPLDESADKIRQEVQGLQVTKDLYTTDAALGKIIAAGEADSAAGDISLLFGYSKLLDPASTVREGEFATLQNSGSMPDIVRNAASRLASGQRLTPDQRKSFIEQGKKIARSGYETYQKALQPQLAAISGRGLNRDYILPKFESFEKMYKQAPAQVIGANQPPPGFNTMQIPGMAQMPAPQGVQVPGLPTAQAYQGPMRPQAFTPQQVQGMSRADKIKAIQAMGQVQQ
jgi:hypothetical protein